MNNYKMIQLNEKVSPESEEATWMCYVLYKDQKGTSGLTHSSKDFIIYGKLNAN